MSKWQDEKEKRNRQSVTRLTRALPGIFPSNVLSRALNRPFVPPTPRLAINSYWRAHPIRADRLARRVRPAAERLTGGPGGLAKTARADCRPPSERRPRRIAKTHTRRVPASAACAGNRCIALAGMSICGIAVPTRMQIGTAPASLPGNSGMCRVTRPACCGVSKHAAVAKPADDYGRPPRLTTESRCFGYGANTGMRHGRHLLDYWGLPNLRVINRDAHAAKCAAEARDRCTARYLASECC